MQMVEQNLNSNVNEQYKCFIVFALALLSFIIQINCSLVGPTNYEKYCASSLLDLFRKKKVLWFHCMIVQPPWKWQISLLRKNQQKIFLILL